MKTLKDGFSETALNEKPVVVKSNNELVNTVFSFSTVELDILFYVLYLVRDGCLSYKFSLTDLQKYSGIEYSSADLFFYTKMLLNHAVVSMYVDQNHWQNVQLFSAVIYDSGNITVELNERSLHIFRQAKNNFTTFQLCSGMSIRSKYAKRLYWLLNEWKGLGGRHRYDIGELRRLLDLSGSAPKVKRSSVQRIVPQDSLKEEQMMDDVEYDVSSRKRYARTYHFVELVRKCVDIINGSTELEVKMVPVRNGRKFMHLDFEVNGKDVVDEVEDGLVSPEKVRTLLHFKTYGLSDSQCEQMWNNGCRIPSFQKVIKELNDTRVRSKKTLVNPIAYLVGGLKNHGFLGDEEHDIVGSVKAKKNEIFGQQRHAVIETIRAAVSKGADISMFEYAMKPFDITDADVLSVGEKDKKKGGR